MAVHWVEALTRKQRGSNGPLVRGTLLLLDTDSRGLTYA